MPRHLLAASALAALVAASGCGLRPGTSTNSVPVTAPAPTTPAAPASPAAGATPATAPAAPTVPGEVPGFAPYPGSSQIGFESSPATAAGVKKNKVKLTSTDQFAQVKAYYQKLVETGGWQITKFQEKPTEAKWDLAQGTSTAEIDIETKVGNIVEISIERKDR